MTLEAVGLLSVLFPGSTWEVRYEPDELLANYDVGRDKLRRIFRELERAKLVKRVRVNQSDGTFTWVLVKGGGK